MKAVLAVCKGWSNILDGFYNPNTVRISVGGWVVVIRSLGLH